MDLELRQKTMVITGGTDGLGLALATRLIAEGAQVAVCGRSRDRLDRAQELLGDRALVMRADVTRAGDCESFVSATLERFGGIDGLVNNAGRAAAASIRDSDDEQWREDYELKVVAAVRMCRLALPALIVRQGAIVNVLAIMAREPHAGSMPTGASRAAGLAMTKALATEVGAQGVRVNALLIGLIASGQWARRAEAAGVSEQNFYDNHPQRSAIALGRFGRREEFADLAAFLLSPRASYLTGVGIALDGGLSPVI